MPVSSASTTPLLLPLDINETIPTNIIQNEIQVVNVPQGQNIIQPVCGAFFADSVILVNTTSNTPMQANVDYMLVGCDINKTKMSTNTSGIYKFILVLDSYVGNIAVTYHAVGGSPTLYDLNALYALMLNLQSIQSQMNYVNPGVVLTSNLPTNPVNNTRAIVTDAMNPTLNSPVVGGGTSVSTVYSYNKSWYVG